MNNQQYSKLEKFTKELSNLHWMMFGGTLLATVVIAFKFSSFEVNFDYSQDIFILVCPLLAIGSILIGKSIFDKRVLGLVDVANFDDKLAGFRAASIVRFALIEGAALVSVVVGLDTENGLYIIISVILLIYLMYLKVTKGRIKEALEL